MLGRAGPIRCTVQLACRSGLERRQLFDAAGVDARQSIAHADAGNHTIGRDFGEWNEHEGALE
jgi:hypothetical protein